MCAASVHELCSLLPVNTHVHRIRFPDTPGLCVLAFCTYSTGLVFKVWSPLSVWFYTEEGSLGPGDWAHHIYSRLSVSQSPLSDTAMVVQPLLVPQSWGSSSESPVLVLALPKFPCGLPGTSNFSTLLGISAINAHVRSFSDIPLNRTESLRNSTATSGCNLCAMNSFLAETESKANAVYKALLIQVKFLLLSLLNCWYTLPERRIGTTYFMHFTPLSRQINSAFSICSCTDRSESLPSKSGISFESKFNDIAEIASNQNEDIWVRQSPTMVSLF